MIDDLFTPPPQRPPSGFRVGAAGWADQSLIRAKTFYPPGVSTAAMRLDFYSRQFNLVEVDSSYYALPTRRNAELWVQRTPPDFLFNIKAFGAMTQHQTAPRALPKDLREQLPLKSGQDKKLAFSSLPPDVLDEIWRRFRDAISVLRQSGKLGVVLLQFPKWFPFGNKQKDYIQECKERLRDFRLAVEFRQRTWMDEEHRDDTLHFLRKNDLVNVAVDEPQGLPNSIPLVPEATTDLAILRLHGRNQPSWNKTGVSVAEKFNYLYSQQELEEFTPVLKKMAAAASETHAVFNNCYQDNGVRNARQLVEILNESPSSSAEAG